MPVTIITVQTKPPGVVWWPKVSPENQIETDEELAWNATQPGYISVTIENPSENVSHMVATFDTIENYRAWQALRQSTPLSYQTRFAYNTANNIVISYIYQ
jgi:antibiotic biosynthesis monooxygenase (ABM) superfamily enzyme